MLIAFEWDDATAERNLAKHRISFEKAAEVVADPNVVIFDVTRKEDGESRLKAIGRIGSRLHTVVHTHRGAVTRLISARRANAKEERSYGDRSQDI